MPSAAFVAIFVTILSHPKYPHGLRLFHNHTKPQYVFMIEFLFKACMELDLGLDEDDWNSIAANLVKDFNKNIRNVAINASENLVILGDFLSELQSFREEKRRRKLKDDNSVSSKLESLYPIEPSSIELIGTFDCFARGDPIQIEIWLLPLLLQWETFSHYVLFKENILT